MSEIGLTSLRPRARLRRPALVHAQRGHRVLQARRRSDGAARRPGRARSLQLHGFVVPDSILRKPDTLEYRFKVQSNGAASSTPRYTGIVPDTFKDEAEVVLKGTARRPTGFTVDAERRDGEVPVEVRGEAGHDRRCASGSRRHRSCGRAMPPRVDSGSAVLIGLQRSRADVRLALHMPWPHSAPSSCSRLRRLRPTRSWRRSPARGAARAG